MGLIQLFQLNWNFLQFCPKWNCNVKLVLPKWKFRIIEWPKFQISVVGIPNWVQNRNLLYLFQFAQIYWVPNFCIGQAVPNPIWHSLNPKSQLWYRTQDLIWKKQAPSQRLWDKLDLEFDEIFFCSLHTVNFSTGLFELNPAFFNLFFNRRGLFSSRVQFDFANMAFGSIPNPAV